MKGIATIFLKLISLYQYIFSPLARGCRYYPTCSNYALIVFKYNNIFCALLKTCYRIILCNPFSKGGFDPPYLYLTQQQIARFYNAYYKQNPCYKPFSKDLPQKVYFFIEADFHLLKWQKFYIIPVHLY